MYGRGARAIAEQINSSVERAQEIVDDFYKSFPSVKTWMDDSLAKLKAKEYVEDFCGRRRRLPDINLEPYKVSRIKPLDNTEGFNPFINCQNREVDDPVKLYWEKVIDEKVKASQKRQQEKAAQAGKTFKPNDEMSNMLYETLAKEALSGIDSKTRKPICFPGTNKPIGGGYKIEAFTGRRSQAERQCVNAMIQGGAASMTKVAMNKIHRDPILNKYGFKMLIGVHDELIGQCKEEYKDICADRLCEVMKTCVSDIVDVPFKCDPSVVRRWYEDEMGYSLQDKVQNLIKEGKTEEEAVAIIRKKNPEFNDEQFQTLLTIE